MPTRIISWQQLVLENDPDWVRQSLNPVVWEFSNGRRFVDPAQLYGVSGPSGLINDGGLLILVEPSGWPTTTVGLAPNALWDNGGVVSAVLGSQQPGSPIYFNNVTASQILLFGAGSMPRTQPEIGSLQLWYNNGVICVA